MRTAERREIQGTVKVVNNSASRAASEGGGKEVLLAGYGGEMMESEMHVTSSELLLLHNTPI